MIWFYNNVFEATFIIKLLKLKLNAVITKIQYIKRFYSYIYSVFYNNFAAINTAQFRNKFKTIITVILYRFKELNRKKEYNTHYILNIK